MRAVAPRQRASCASDVARHVSPCIWLAGRRTAPPHQSSRARRLVSAAVAVAALSDDDAKKSNTAAAGPSTAASTSSPGGQAASVARRRAAVSRSRQQQQQQQKQKQRKQEETTTTTTTTSKSSSSNRSAPTLVKATSTQKKRQRANAAALGAAARNAPEKDGYKKLTQEDEAKLCANIKELRRLETLEPPIGPQSTPSQHAAAWAEAASVPSAAELARRVAAGRDSERRLLEAHAGLAHALASAATPLGIAGGRRASMRSMGGGGAGQAAGLEHGDFLGEARAALLRAAAAYDPTRGSSLSSLAALAGRRSLGDYAAAHGRTVAAPKSARYAVAAMAKARRALILEREEKRVGGEGAGGAGAGAGGGEEYQPTFEEVAKAAGLSPAAARAAFAATRAESGFEGFGAFVSSKAGGGGSQAALDEGTEDDGAAAAASSATMTTVSAASSGVVSEFTVFETSAAASLSGTSSSDDDGAGGMDRDGMERSRWWAKQQQRELSEKLSALLATMPRRDREAVRLRYGLDGGAPRSWAEVGAALRPPVGGEAIRQALAKRSAALAVGRGGRGAAEALRALRSLVEVQDDDDDDDDDDSEDEEEDEDEDGEGRGGGRGRSRGRGSSSGARKAAPPLPLPPRAKAAAAAAAAAASKKPTSSSAPASSSSSSSSSSPPPPPPPSSSSPASISRSSPWEEDVKARA